MRIVHAAGILPQVEDNLNSDQTIMYRLDCTGTEFATAAAIAGAQTYETIVVCSRVDISNFCAKLPAAVQLGITIEVYADGGEVEIFADSTTLGVSATFLDGSASVLTSTGVRFRTALNSNLNYVWAFLI